MVLLENAPKLERSEANEPSFLKVMLLRDCPPETLLEPSALMNVGPLKTDKCVNCPLSKPLLTGLMRVYESPQTSSLAFFYGNIAGFTFAGHAVGEDDFAAL